MCEMVWGVGLFVCGGVSDELFVVNPALGCLAALEGLKNAGNQSTRLAAALKDTDEEEDEPSGALGELGQQCVCLLASRGIGVWGVACV